MTRTYRDHTIQVIRSLVSLASALSSKGKYAVPLLCVLELLTPIPPGYKIS